MSSHDPNTRVMETIDANEAVAHIAHSMSEFIAIYPIAPSINTGEHSDAWSADGQKNIWGTIPLVVDMQGKAGAVHGVLRTGSLTTTAFHVTAARRTPG